MYCCNTMIIKVARAVKIPTSYDSLLHYWHSTARQLGACHTAAACATSLNWLLTDAQNIFFWYNSRFLWHCRYIK